MVVSIMIKLQQGSVNYKCLTCIRHLSGGQSSNSLIHVLYRTDFRSRNLAFYSV